MFMSLVALLPFYLLGAFPTGRLIARMHGVDITTQGSGNVGATNVARVLGAKAGVATLLIDILKGLFGILAAQWWFGSSWLAAAAGVALVAGHCFSIPPWLRGGKGVATALGVLVGISPMSALVALIIFAIVFTTTKIVSLASITSAILVPLSSLLSDVTDSLFFAQALIAGLLVFRHRENIQRLIEGREPKFGARKREASGTTPD